MLSIGIKILNNDIAVSSPAIRASARGPGQHEEAAVEVAAWAGRRGRAHGGGRRPTQAGRCTRQLTGGAHDGQRETGE